MLLRFLGVPPMAMPSAFAPFPGSPAKPSQLFVASPDTDGFLRSILRYVPATLPHQPLHAVISGVWSIVVEARERMSCSPEFEREPVYVLSSMISEMVVLDVRSRRKNPLLGIEPASAIYGSLFVAE